MILTAVRIDGEWFGRDTIPEITEDAVQLVEVVTPGSRRASSIPPPAIPLRSSCPPGLPTTPTSTGASTKGDLPSYLSPSANGCCTAIGRFPTRVSSSSGPGSG
jgi:hypothetical protein